MNKNVKAMLAQAERIVNNDLTFSLEAEHPVSHAQIEARKTELEFFDSPAWRQCARRSTVRARLIAIGFCALLMALVWRMASPSPAVQDLLLVFMLFFVLVLACGSALFAESIMSSFAQYELQAAQAKLQVTPLAGHQVLQLVAMRDASPDVAKYCAAVGTQRRAYIHAELTWLKTVQRAEIERTAHERLYGAQPEVARDDQGEGRTV